MLVEALEVGLRAVSIDDGITVRLSNSGVCARALVRDRLGLPSEAKPLKMYACAEMGHAIEASVVEWLEVGGLTVIDRQREVNLRIGDVLIPGHLDCRLIVGDADGQKFPVDVKGMSQFVYADFDKNGTRFAAFPNVRAMYSQINAYMDALRSEGEHVEGGYILALNRSSGEVKEEYVAFDELEAKRIRERWARVLEATEDSSILREHTVDEGGFLVKACEWCRHNEACWGPLDQVMDGKKKRLMPAVDF